MVVLCSHLIWRLIKLANQKNSHFGRSPSSSGIFLWLSFNHHTPGFIWLSFNCYVEKYTWNSSSPPSIRFERKLSNIWRFPWMTSERILDSSKNFAFCLFWFLTAEMLTFVVELSHARVFPSCLVGRRGRQSQFSFVFKTKMATKSNCESKWRKIANSLRFIFIFLDIPLWFEMVQDFPNWVSCLTTLFLTNSILFTRISHSCHTIKWRRRIYFELFAIWRFP